MEYTLTNCPISWDHLNIFHNLITDNNRGINLTNGGSADIDANVITGNTERGISLLTNASVRLSSDSSHYGKVPGLTSLENNLIQGNDFGVRCALGGSASGNPQNFGTGNTTANTQISGSCPISSSLNFP